MNLNCLAFLLFALFIHISKPTLLPRTTVYLNQPVTIPFSGTCKNCIIEWKHRQMTSGGLLPLRTIASLDEGTGVFKTEMGFENRVKPVIDNGSLALQITSVVRNDNGWFELHCNNTYLQDAELNVFVLTPIFAVVGENATLTCYSFTDKLTNENAKYLRWEKDGHVLINITAGNITYVKPEFKGRVSVSLEGYGQGDHKLTLFDVQSSDQGIYDCFIGLDHQRGNPEAVDFTVNSKVKKKQAEEVGTFLQLIRNVIVFPMLLIAILLCGIFIHVTMGLPEFFQKICSKGGSHLIQNNTANKDEMSRMFPDNQDQHKAVTDTLLRENVDHLSIFQRESGTELEEDKSTIRMRFPCEKVLSRRVSDRSASASYPVFSPEDGHSAAPGSETSPQDGCPNTISLVTDVTAAPARGQNN